MTNRSNGGPRPVVFLANNADLYGASRALLRMVRGLDHSRFAPVIIVPQDGPLVGMLRAAGATVDIESCMGVVTRSAVRPGRIARFGIDAARACLSLRSIIRRHKACIVHTNVGTIAPAGCAARLARVPHVWHIRDWFAEFGPLWSAYRRYMTSTADRVICISKAVAGQFTDDPKLETLYDGLFRSELPAAMNQERAAFRAAHGLGDGFVVGCVGRIKVARKGQEILIRAVRLARDRGVDAVALIVGSPYAGNESHLAEIRGLVRDLRLVDHVVFAGELDDVNPAYAAMDAFVLPSATPEPFGLVLLEAMAHRKPVIANRVGGPAEVVADGETGFLVPPGDPDALAARMETLARQPGLARTLGENARKRVETSFPAERTIARISEIYDSIARTRTP